MNKSVGILGVAAYLPPNIRTNDHWPESVARAWKERALQKHESTQKHLQADGSRAAGFDMISNIVHRAEMVVTEALDDATLKAEDVDFYACHQPFKWFRPASLEAIGLKKAKSFEHFPFTASLSAANLPFQMAAGEKEGLLREGDLVACFQGGTGSTISGMTLRWGR